MGSVKIENCLHEYNNIFKENDNIYRDVAKRLGLSECAFWILYVLRADDTISTQSEICGAWYQSKQTVNSALKNLEANGYIELRCVKDRRSKSISLTDKGINISQKTVDKVIKAEQEALSSLNAEEQEAFISLFHKYTDALKAQMQKFV